MTIDEARAAVVISAARCLQQATCKPKDLLRILRGIVPENLHTLDARLATAHRRVLRDIRRAGHGDVIADELEGIVSATGLALGRIVNVDLIVSQAQIGERDGSDGDG